MTRAGRGSGPRHEPWSASALGPEQRQLYDAIVNGPRGQRRALFRMTDKDGALLGPFGGFLLSPQIGDVLQRLGAAVRYQGQLSDRARELAILTVAVRRNSAFEIYAHSALGRACLLTEDEIVRLCSARPVELTDPDEAAVLELTTAMLDGDVDDATWCRCVPPLTEALVFELTTLVGYYSTLALQMRVFRTDEVPPDPDRP